MGDKLPLGYGLPKEGNDTSIQVAGTVYFQDGSETPNVSPKGSVGTTPEELVVPDGAVVLWIKGDSAIRVGASSTLDGSDGQGYATLTADQREAFPCADLSSVYVAADTGTVEIDFYFERLTQ